MREVSFAASPLGFWDLWLGKVVAYHWVNQHEEPGKRLFATFHELHCNVHCKARTSAVAGNHDPFAVDTKLFGAGNDVFEYGVSVKRRKWVLGLRTEPVSAVNNYALSIAGNSVANRNPQC